MMPGSEHLIELWAAAGTWNRRRQPPDEKARSRAGRGSRSARCGPFNLLSLRIAIRPR